uniref:Nucleolar protein 16 n=1 Tax=Angiostrongylus cantonensis TaxID=6313 RepID=A0A0K0CTU0_ANGCA
MIEVRRYKKKAADVKKKRRIFSTDFGGKKSQKQVLQQAVDNETGQVGYTNVVNKEDETALHARTEKDDLGKKEQSSAEELCQETMQLETSVQNKRQIERRSNKRPNSFSKRARTVDEVNVSDSRLRAYGINPKKFRNRVKFAKKKMQLDK